MSEPPKIIGRFPIINTLGIGGMGMVYSAKDPDIGRLVAIKVLHSNGDKEALERFKNEARTIGEISHPNIVMLLEYGIDDKKPFLVMEHLAGESIETWRTKSHKLIEHRNILLDLCGALKYAHSKDILHRDLKPGNIQILPSGQAKLLDFGIARSSDTGLTATGFFIGTPQFLAPEILESTNHSQASDCYSLGVLAYTMLVGINPFAGKSFEATMTKQLTLIPTLLHEINSNIPVALSNVIASYLDKNPETRPQSPELLEKALHKITESKQLNKVIFPIKEFKIESSNTTIIFSNKKSISKFKLKLFVPILILLIIASTSVIYYMYKKDVNPAINKIDTQTSVQPLENFTENNNKSNEIDSSISKPDNEVDVINGELVEAQKSTIEDPEESNITPADTNVAKKSNSNSKPEVKNENEKEKEIKKDPIVINKQPETIKTIAQKKEPSSKSPATIKIVNKPENKVDSLITNKTGTVKSISDPSTQVTSFESTIEDNKNSEPIVKDKTPVFTLPALNHKASKVNLKAITSTNMSRGKTKTLIIDSSKNISFDRFTIYRGRVEFKQIKVRNFSPLNNNQIQLSIYVESNTPLGNYTLFGFHNENKTSPINLKVTL